MGRGVARAVGRSVGSAAGSSSSFNIGEIIGICVGIAVGLLALYCICGAICGGGCSDSTSESPPPATGKEQRCDQAGSLVVPGRGYDWANPNDPSDLTMQLKPNLVAHGDGRVVPALGFAWANPQDAEDERVVQVPIPQMSAPAAADQSVEMAVMPVSLLPNEAPGSALDPAPRQPPILAVERRSSGQTLQSCVALLDLDGNSGAR